jgi:hypothetical protein
VQPVTWGPRVIEEAALWDALDYPASLRAYR